MVVCLGAGDITKWAAGWPTRSSAEEGACRGADASPRAGKLTPNAPLAPLVWFKSGGAAEWLFEPKDVADLQPSCVISIPRCR
jgi:hypothetical protein